MLKNEDALGTIRNELVSISKTVYVPSHAPQLLDEMLTQTVERQK